MIDLALLRTKEGLAKVADSEKKRGNSLDRVNKVADMIEERIKGRYEMEQLNKEFNQTTKEASVFFKSKEQSARKDELVAKINEIRTKRSDCVARLASMEKETDDIAREIGNLLEPSVAVGMDEEYNPVIFTREYIKKDFLPTQLLSFDKILEKLGAVDTERGTKISGHRGYFLKNAGVLLAQALVRYGMDFLRRQQYDLIQTPYIMSREAMSKTAQLSDFDDQLYKVEGAATESYLIATSEQPISALHSDEWFRGCDLPIRYAGYSTCFRKEAGAHGKDNRGIFRVHQFEKIEQFILAAPERSMEEFQGMVERSKEFYDSLGFGYRVVSIVSGALNNAAAIKYDLEAYFPESGRYRELVSCSNCTDYQSRDLNIRYNMFDQNTATKEFVHLLNGTLCAVQRTLCCLVENYQTEEGVVVPKVLVPYVGEEFLPYVGTKDAKV
ncbi:seryl-tRNA synthetase [Nematocida homosporus]|uniref:seryl-tRNA synthetase n=1 Tax=Nematocida homosporus TaxID=1912981 RepID=UPI00221F259D|nr:seryl-tRNA synthetase [Nematocida homosporus]KAI5186387.1 seryl-tRNA synthetase [Nematocida homosporus]